MARTSFLRRLEQAIENGTKELESGYDLLRRGNEHGAEKSARQALHHLRLALVLVRFDPSRRAEVSDEIERAEHLLDRLASVEPPPDSPANAILLFDEHLSSGDDALRNDDLSGAQLAYFVAYSALYSLLPDGDTAGLPTPPESGVEVPDRRTHSKGGGRCELCWVELAEDDVRFRDEDLSSCSRCVRLVGGRFQRSAQIYTRCERLVEDLREITETAHGLPWLSPIEMSESTSSIGNENESEVTAERVHLLRDLVAVFQRVGHPPTPEDVQQHGSFSISEYRTVFGSWEDALREGGFDYDSR